MKKVFKGFVLLLVVSFMFANMAIAFADKYNDTTPELAGSKAIIGDGSTTAVTTDAQLSGFQSEVTANISPSGIVETKVRAIGSGLVDLDTSISMNMVVNEVNGTHYFVVNGGRIGAGLYLTGNRVNFANFSDQFIQPVGTVITSCSSSGTVYLNWYQFTEPFVSVPYDLYAVVY